LEEKSCLKAVGRGKEGGREKGTKKKRGCLRSRKGKTYRKEGTNPLIKKGAHP